MKVLVTGANGHIGANVVRALIKQGHDVRGFVRQASDTQGIDGLDIELCYGDVMNADSLEQAAIGCDAIIHLAAVYKTIAKTADEIVEPAIEGAKNVFAAAHKAGIKRIVYTSSVASIGFSYDPNEKRTGNDWNDDPHNPYYIAKTKSEQAAQALAKEYGIHVVVICPAIVLGPYDYRITPSNQMIKDWINGKGQTYVGGLNFVDVRDVADIHVAALTKGENYHRYIAGGENMEVKKAGLLLKKLTGIKPIHLGMSRKITLITAKVVETLCKTIGLTPPFTYDLVYEVAERYAYYEFQDTIDTLGVTPRKAEESIKGAIQWLLDNHKIKPSIEKKVKRQLESNA
ncbi:NAD-dependent epimerase/dehydratase family protein [Alkalimarinus sediminis]|uniref:NAD-dependent epimerase/dehydratase family protein n=1 Tax=Alkalimarinus sediminis TaxID=1632866 RepID=A0A9E8KQM7_9ALTE|nr:NAD-dependent epimerase/dehydratase family protein [Alkalimarinus sediminis]UZW76613.1 NAD-dependent epimerase/dehydratase family protein [Alkalimarinus sediminis]